MRTLTLIAIAVLSVPSCTRYMHDGRRGEAGYHHAHAAHHGHGRAHGTPCDRAGVIGLAIDQHDDAPRSALVVERVAPGGPADDANIQPGDRIVEIDGESTRGMTESEAARLIRGRVDTAVEIRIDSPRGDRIITLVRVSPSSVWGRPDHRRGERRPCDKDKRRYGKRKCDSHKCDTHKCEKKTCAKREKCAEKPCRDKECDRCCHGERTKKKSDCKRARSAPCDSRTEERTMVPPQHDGDDEPEDEGSDR